MNHGNSFCLKRPALFTQKAQTKSLVDQKEYCIFIRHFCTYDLSDSAMRGCFLWGHFQLQIKIIKMSCVVFITLTRYRWCLTRLLRYDSFCSKGSRKKNYCHFQRVQERLFCLSVMDSVFHSLG